MHGEIATSKDSQAHCGRRTRKHTVEGPTHCGTQEHTRRCLEFRYADKTLIQGSLTMGGHFISLVGFEGHICKREAQRNTRQRCLKPEVSMNPGIQLYV